MPNAQITRDGSLDVRDRILQISPGQRKNLGINKSTLWYQKRKLSEGKSVKIYNRVLTKLAK